MKITMKDLIFVVVLCLHGAAAEQNRELRIVLLGKTGVGKSTTGNTILGRQCFESKFSAKSTTIDSAKGKAMVYGQQVAVIDTPGLFDTRYDKDKTAKDISQCISYSSPGPHVFLVIIRLGRFTEEEKNTVQRIQEIFGEAADKYSMVLFTGGDLLESTIEEFLAESSDLQELVARCNGQYHVFYNKDHSQVPELLQKIRDIVQKNGGSHYTNDMFQEAERQLQEEAQRILKEKEVQIQKEKEELEKKLMEQHEKQMLKFKEQLQAEREKEREQEKIDREEERKRDNKEREEEKSKWKLCMEMFALKKEEREREVERRKNRDDDSNRIKELEERFERELSEEKKKLQYRYEVEARKRAERSNPIWNFFKKAFKTIVGLFTPHEAGIAIREL